MLRFVCKSGTQRIYAHIPVRMYVFPWVSKAAIMNIQAQSKCEIVMMFLDQNMSRSFEWCNWCSCKLSPTANAG
jgi:hypothetical protein